MRLTKGTLIGMFTFTLLTALFSTAPAFAEDCDPDVDNCEEGQSEETAVDKAASGLSQLYSEGFSGGYTWQVDIICPPFCVGNSTTNYESPSAATYASDDKTKAPSNPFDPSTWLQFHPNDPPYSVQPTPIGWAAPQAKSGEDIKFTSSGAEVAESIRNTMKDKSGNFDPGSVQTGNGFAPVDKTQVNAVKLGADGKAMNYSPFDPKGTSPSNNPTDSIVQAVTDTSVDVYKAVKAVPGMPSSPIVDQVLKLPNFLNGRGSPSPDTSADGSTDPIDAGTGEYRNTWTDLQLDDVGPSIVVQRTYRSRQTRTGILGHNWNFSYDQHLINLVSAIKPNVTGGIGCQTPHFRWVDGVGNIIDFIDVDGGSHIQSVPDGATKLTFGADAFATIQKPDGQSFGFDEAGNLVWVSDRNGNKTVVWWSKGICPSIDQNWRLSKVSSPHHAVKLEYDCGTGFLSEIYVEGQKDSTLTSYYVAPENAAGTLLSATSPTGVTESYEYAQAPYSGPVVPNDQIPTPEARIVCDSACEAFNPDSVCGAQTSAAIEMTCGGALEDCPASCQQSCDSQCGDNIDVMACAIKCAAPSLQPSAQSGGMTGCKAYAIGNKGHCEARVDQICGGACLIAGIDNCDPKTIQGGSFKGDPVGFEENFYAAIDAVGSALFFTDYWTESHQEWECLGCYWAGKFCGKDNCQEGRTCKADCMAGLHGAVDPCDANDPPTQDVCADIANEDKCNVAAEAKCIGACAEPCVKACVEQCPASCKTVMAQCVTMATSPVTGPQLHAQCVDQCMSNHGQIQGQDFYGHAADLKYNLTAIKDGNDKVWLSNVYGMDVFSPSFDRVTQQYFGEAYGPSAKPFVEIRYVDLKNGTYPRDADLVTVMHESPNSYSVCPTDDTDLPSPLSFGPPAASSKDMGDTSDVAFASMTVDAAGNQWTFMSDRFGRVLRRVNPHFKSKANGATNSDHTAIIINYDDAGRPLGYQTEFGDRYCNSYSGANWFPSFVTHLPAQGVPNAQAYVWTIYTWSPQGDLLFKSQPNSFQGAIQIDRDPFGNVDLVTRWVDDGSSFPLTTSYTRLSDGSGRVATITKNDGDSRTFSYSDSDGLWQTATWNGSRTLTSSRDALGHLTGVSGAGASKWSADVDARGMPNWIFQREGTAQELEEFYTYDPATGREMDILAPDRDTKPTWFAWGGKASLRTISLDGPQSNTVCYAYDERRLLAAVYVSGGTVTEYTRDSRGDVVAISRGLKSHPYAWDPQWADATCVPGGLGPQQIYWSAVRMNSGQILSIQDGAPAGKAIGYDGFGRMISVQQEPCVAGNCASGLERPELRFIYDEADRVLWSAIYRLSPQLAGGPADPTAIPVSTDPALAGATNVKYDFLGRATSVSKLLFTDLADGTRQQQSNVSESYEYSDLIKTVTHVDASGHSHLKMFDVFGQLVHESNTSTNSVLAIDHVFSTDGLIETTTAAGPSASMERKTKRSPTGRLLSIETTGGKEKVTYAYDIRDRVSTVNEGVRTFTRAYDFLGRLASTARVSPSGAKLPHENLTYNVNGQLMTYEDGNGNGTTWNYDDLGRVVSAIYPDGTQISFPGYLGGTALPLSLTSRDGDHQTFAYDEQGRLLSINSDGTGATYTNATTTINYTYGIFGIASADSSTSTPSDAVQLGFGYDSLGRMVRESNSLFPGEDLGHTWTPTGLPASLDLGTAVSMSWFRDEIGRVTDVTTLGVTIQHCDYPGFGGPSACTRSNGVSESYGYDADGRVSQYSAVSPVGPLLSMSVFRDAQDLVSRTDQQFDFSASAVPASDVFAYDDYGRLGAEDHGLVNPTSTSFSPSVLTTNASAKFEGFSYDAAENIATKQEGANPPFQSQCGLDNRYELFGGHVFSTVGGALTQAPGTPQFEYDGLQRLVQASVLSDGTPNPTHFVYDGLGRLAAYDTPSADPHGSPTRTLFQYARGAVLREVVGTSTKTYVPGRLGLPIFMWGAHGAQAHLHPMSNGRVGFASDTTGGLLERYAYTAYGETSFLDAGGTGLAKSSFGFDLNVQGQPYVPTLGLHRFGARWYSPTLARFLTPDPVGYIGGPNFFAYADDVPTWFGDPWGLGSKAAENPLNQVSTIRWHQNFDGTYSMFTLGDLLAPLGDLLYASLGGPSDGTMNIIGVVGLVAPAGAALNAARAPAAFAEAAEFAKAAETVETTTIPRPALSAPADAAVRYGPMNPGPLPTVVADTFRSGTYTARTSSEATTLYRAYGGTAGEVGGYWTRSAPAGPLQAQIDLALRPEWGNTATSMSQINVPAGTVIYEGAAAGQGGPFVGGGSQVYIPHVDPSWVVR